MKDAIAPPTRGQGFGKGQLSPVANALLNQSDSVGPSRLQASVPGGDVDVEAIAQSLFKKGIRKSAGNTAATIPIPTTQSAEPTAAVEPEIVEPVEDEDVAAESSETTEDSATTSTDDGSVTLSASDLAKLLDKFEPVQERSQELEQQLEAMRAELAQAQAALQQSAEVQQQQAEEVEASQSAVEVLNRLSQLTGVTVQNMSPPDVKKQHGQGPHIAKLTNPVAKGPSGAYGEFVREFESAPSTIMQSGSRREVVRDTAAYDAIARRNPQEVMRGLEKDMHNQGLLRGGATTGALTPSGHLQQASTTIADVGGYFLPRISSLQRMTNSVRYIFHQFVYTEIAFGRGQGATVRFPREASLIPRPTQMSDRILSGGRVFIPTSTATTPLQTGYKEISIKECGLGRATIGDPIGWSTFTEMFSLQSFMRLADRCLRDDYLAWVDVSIRSILKRTSVVAWNKKGRLTDQPANVGTGDDGTLSVGFITAGAMYMEQLGIPTIDGYYMLCVPSTVMTAFVEGIDDKLDLGNVSQQQIVRNVIQTYGSNENEGIEGQAASGFVGIVSNVMIFRSNAFGTGAPGTDSSQSETLGDTNTYVTRSCYMFGAGTIAHPEAMPYEVRPDMSPFEREERLIWLSYENYDSLDVSELNPSAESLPVNSQEQTRCIELRVLEAKI